jgi:hypothetical protein
MVAFHSIGYRIFQIEDNYNAASKLDIISGRGTASEWHHTTSNSKDRVSIRGPLAMDHLADILQSVGISEYLDRFIDAGFSTWVALLEITEDEL